MPTSSHESAGRRRILIVEDDVDLRETLAETLADAGHEVVTAVDGADGLARMRALRPDVVVLDLVMPGMDGWQFRIEQKRDPALADTPVIAVSASNSAAAAAVDADLYLRKPFAVRDLADAVDRLITVRARRAALVDSVETERLAAVGTLAAGIAHEIDKPLTYVLLNLAGAMQHLATAVDSQRFEPLSRVRTMLEEALSGSQRIRGIVRGVQLLSNEEGAAPAPLDVRRVLEGSLRVVHGDVAARARLSAHYGPVPLVLADEGRLGQMFVELLRNAAQSIAPGAPDDHEIRVITETDARGRARIAIADTGGGIPEPLLGHIFEPFYTTQPAGHGAGLGLSISLGIVRALGGELTVNSQVGAGTTIAVVLPAAAAAPSRLVAHTHVLVVDGDPATGEVVRTALGADYDVTLAFSARQALDRLYGDLRPDLVLCDVHMPGISGLDLYRRVRKVWPELAAKMVFMTGRALAGEARAALEADERLVLDKPLDPGHLTGVVARIATRHRA
jgi:CheY-like chemotaxis protein